MLIHSYLLKIVVKNFSKGIMNEVSEVLLFA